MLPFYYRSTLMNAEIQTPFIKSLIHLTISRQYVSTWSIWEAIREIVQNAYDTKTHKITYENDTMIVNTSSGTLDRRNLLLGISSKRDDEHSIGTYGEGFKLALLVLLREGRTVQIQNGSDLWTPVFVSHDQIEEECLAIEIQEGVVDNHDGQVTYMISGLSEDEISDIQDKTLYQFDRTKIEAYHDRSFCWYKEDTRGKLYVGGLFVCELEKEFQMSYNFAPNLLHLDRDRKMVNSFYISMEASKLMVLSDNLDLLSELADNGAPDVSDYYDVDCYYSSGGVSSEQNVKLKQVVSDKFTKSYGLNAYPINASANEKEKRVQTIKAMEAGLTPVVIKAGYYNMLNKDLKNRQISNYNSFNPSAEIAKFYDEHKNQLRGKPRRALEALIAKIELYEGKTALPEVISERNIVEVDVDDIPF